MNRLTFPLLIVYGLLCFIAGWQFHGDRVNASIDYREFASPEVFAEWGAQQPLLGEWTITREGNANVARYSIVADCDKQAEFLQLQGLRQGYFVSQQIVNKNGYIGNTYVANTKGQYHVGLITAIENQWWYMDSFTRDVIKIQLTRD